MDLITHYIDWPDLAALLFFAFCWFGYARFSEHSSRVSKSLLAVTNAYRLDWMIEMIKRDNRSTDAIMVGNLQRSITFFANTTIFIVFGLISMLSYHERSSAILSAIPFAAPTTALVWEIKIFLLIVIFIYAFFKYTWSLRQYNYAGIFISSVPPIGECRTQIDAIAAKGSYLVGNAAKHFNNGLRAYYFGLAALSWFIDPYLFITVTAWVVFVTHRREYRSTTLANLAR